VIRDWAEGPQCPYASLSAAYLSGAPWGDVASFYQDYMRRAGWGQVERRIVGRDTTANADQEVIEARWPFAAGDRRSLRLTIANFNNLPIAPPQTPQTLFTVEVEYIPDFDFFRSSHLCQD